MSFSCLFPFDTGYARCKGHPKNTSLGASIVDQDMAKPKIRMIAPGRQKANIRQRTDLILMLPRLRVRSFQLVGGCITILERIRSQLLEVRICSNPVVFYGYDML